MRMPVNKLSPNEPPTVPALDDLIKDISDGCCMATVISFYCPDSLKLHGKVHDCQNPADLDKSGSEICRWSRIWIRICSLKKKCFFEF